MIWQYGRELLALAFVVVLGYGVVATVLGRLIRLLPRVELLSYSLALGVGVLGAGMLILSTLHVPFSLPTILWVGAAPLALLLRLRLLKPRDTARATGSDPGSGAPAQEGFSCAIALPRPLVYSLLAVTLAFVLIGCLSEPTAEVDAVGAWALHAKVFFYERTAFPEYLTSGACGPVVSHWPPLLPLLETWIHLGMGGYDDLKVKVVFFLIYAAMLGLVFGTLKRLIGASYGAAMLVLIATAPAIIVPFPSGSVASAHADVPLAMFLAGTTGLLISWLARDNLRYLLLASLLVASAMWLKREGLVFACISGALVCFLALRRAGRSRRARIMPALLFTLAPVVSVFLLGLYKSRFPGAFAGDTLEIGRFLSAESALRFVKLAGYLALEAVNPVKWGFLWLLLLTLVTLRVRQAGSRIIALPLAVMVGHVAVALAFMAISGYSVRHHVNLDMRRVLIQIAPVAALTVGLLSASSERLR
ncbi:MAG: glycosyltransferase family 39 protein [Candidatus Eisenbacteria bacterium]